MQRAVLGNREVEIEAAIRCGAETEHAAAGTSRSVRAR